MLVLNIAVLAGRGQEEHYRTCLLRIHYTAVRSSWYCVYLTVQLMVFGEIIAIGGFIRRLSTHYWYVQSRVVLQQAVKAVISATLSRLLPYILHTFYDRCSSRSDVLPVPSVSAVQPVWPIANHGISLRISVQSDTHMMRVIELRRMRWARYVARMGARRDACRILARKSE